MLYSIRYRIIPSPKATEGIKQMGLFLYRSVKYGISIIYFPPRGGRTKHLSFKFFVLPPSQNSYMFLFFSFKLFPSYDGLTRREFTRLISNYECFAISIPPANAGSFGEF